MRVLARIGASASSLAEFRAAAIAHVVARVPADVALLHALSPRVPLSTAALHGVDAETVARTLKHWDTWAVELGRFRDVALENDGVATDREAVPLRGRARTIFEKAFGMGRRARAGAMVHLVVRARIVAVLVLVRFRNQPFDAREVAFLRSIAPTLSIADALHQELDGAERVAVKTSLRCEDQRLTPRQRDVVERVALGHTNEEIARALGLSSNTVRNLLADVMRRLGAANRADVVRLAVLR